MADPERDQRVSANYRALGREEPTAALDTAILAAAKRRRPRWGIPVSIAAVLVLAAGVTLRMQQEQPDAETAAPAPQAMKERRPAPSAGENAPHPAADALAPASAPAAGAVLQSRATMETAAKQTEEALAPEPWLDRIAAMRKAGRDKDADESYAAFKRKFPDYRIPEAMLGKVAPAQ